MVAVLEREKCEDAETVLASGDQPNLCRHFFAKFSLYGLDRHNLPLLKKIALLGRGLKDRQISMGYPQGF